ncbi:MAG: protein kinase, partial [Pseudomonadales bacterium]|nr:protein kinase [Pseudomonadales bacterium]
MAFQPVEGQDFGAHYSLLHRIAENDYSENWLALDKELNERILIKVYKTPLDDAVLSKISRGVASLKGLIHPHIARLYDLGKHEERDFIVCQYIRGAEPWRPVRPFSEEWPVLKHAFDAIEFAHGLSIAHGHLHPANLLIDETGNLIITDFGLPATREHEYRDYLSPQIRDGQSPDVSDDIYSLGCHLFRALTGRHWRSGETFQSDSPIRRELQDLVRRMLHDSPYERPGQVSRVRETIERTLEGEDPTAPLQVQPTGFNRRQEPDASPAGMTHKLPRERQVMSASTAFLGFALLILLVAAVFLLLPEQEVERDTLPPSAPAVQSQPPASEPAGQAEPELAPFEIARLERLKEQGKEIA